MKRKFSRILSMVLTVVMLMSLIQLPAFAADLAFRDTGIGTSNRTWTAPYGDELSHYDFSAVGGTGSITYALSSEKEAASIDRDGVLTLNALFDATGAGRVNVTTSTGGSIRSGLIQYVADTPFIHNFDTDPYCLSHGNVIYDNDTCKTKIFEHVDVETDAQGNTYMVSSNSSENYIDFTRHAHSSTTNGNISPSGTILTADVKLSETEDFVLMVFDTSKDKEYPFFKWDHNTGIATDPNGKTTFPSVLEPGWHKIKIMLTGQMKDAANPAPHRETYGRYALFLDDELLTPTKKMPFNLKSGRNIRFEGLDGIDNFKYYGSSTPHAYNVGVANTPKSGGTVGGSALMHSIENFTNSETHYIYSYYVSDTANSAGSYTQVVSSDASDPLFINDTGKLVINGDYTGRYIKTGARVWNRGGMSPEIMSKQAFEIQDFDTVTVTGGISSNDARFRLEAPFEGDLQWSFITVPSGVTLTKDGLFTVNSSPSGTGLFKVQNIDTGDTYIAYLNCISNSTTYDVDLDQVVEPVIFKADINLNDTTEIKAGTLSFDVTPESIENVACSDGATFKFVVENDVYYAFVGDEFIGSDAFTENITRIDINGACDNYYAGSPLTTDGVFVVCSIVDACDSNWIEAPVVEFYNESGVYPETYGYEWYIDGVSVSTESSFKIPGGSVGKKIYCDVTGNGVTKSTNELTIGSQYTLVPSSPGNYTVSLNTENKEVYVFFVGDNKKVFVADMADGEPVSVVNLPEDNYNMFFVNKADLSPRGVSTRIVGTAFSDGTLDIGARSNLAILARNKDLKVASSGVVLFEDPATYQEIIDYIQAKCQQNPVAYVSDVILDAVISDSVATTYADFDVQPEGLYNIISIDDVSNVTETEVYNRLYELFDDSANYGYENFEAIAQKALSLSDEEIDALLAQLAEVNVTSNIPVLMGTNGEYFPAVVFFQGLSELSAPSDASLKSLENHLKKAGLPSYLPKIMELTAYYTDEMATVVASDGLATVIDKLAKHMILTEVQSGFNNTNVRLVLAYIGSSKYNNASKDAQTFVAETVSKKPYGDIASLKTAVEKALDKYVPVEPDTNEDADNNYSGPSTSITISGSVTPPTPPVVQPQPSVQSFSDTPKSHWAFDYVEKMANAGVLNGYDGDFRPDNNITRAEFVKVLCTAFDIKAEGNAEFDDVSADSWYAPYVNALATAGIAKGDGSFFRPDEQISRQDAAVLLQRVLIYVGIELADGELSFTDSDDMSDYAKAAVASLVKAGVINGMEDGSYAPIENITRAQVAKLICVAIELGGDK